MTDVQTIPGVTAMAACAAAVGRPLAEGREPLLVWPDEPPADAAGLLGFAPNVVFMKAGRHLDELAEVAESAGAEAVAVRRASQAGAADHDRPARVVGRPRVLHHRADASGRRRRARSGNGAYPMAVRMTRPGRPCPREEASS